MTALAQAVIKGKTLLDHGFSLFLGHGIPQLLVSVSQAYELHWSLLCSGGLIQVKDAPLVSSV
jgi:hypothetical protein